MGVGALSPSLYPIRIPSARCLTEACLFNYLREFEKVPALDAQGLPRFDFYFMVIIAYMAEYVYLVETYSLDSLYPPFREFVHAFMTGECPFYVARDRLIASEKGKKKQQPPPNLVAEISSGAFLS